MGVDTEWLDKQVGDYTKQYYGRYKEYAAILRAILTRLKDDVLPDGFVQAREKKAASFAAKCVKYHETVGNPLDDFNDLCGGRIIVHTTTEVKKLATLCRKIFDVNEPLSRNVSNDLKAREFGYGSEHLIVRLDVKKLREAKIFSRLKDLTPASVKRVGALKAEIQLRTVAQHAWADFEHDVSYKSEFAVPRSAQRKSGEVAAMVETIDRTFVDVADNVSLLRTNAGVYRAPDDAKAEILKLNAILRHSSDARLAYRVVRLHMTLGQFKEALAAANKFTGEKDASFKGLRGYVQCLVHSQYPKSRSFAEGRKQILKAADEQAALEPGLRDSEILCWIAETAWGEPDAQVARCWKRAYDADPRSPRALAGHLRFIQAAEHAQTLEVVRPNIELAMDLCQQHVSAGVNLPYSLYYLAEYHLIQSKELATPEERKHAYLATYMLMRAVCLSHNPRIVEDALAATTRLRVGDPHLTAAEWCRQTLLLALSVPPWSKKISLHPGLKATPKLAIDTSQDVMIVAGGCDPKHEETMEHYRNVLEYALQDFKGTVTCGGTREGISGIVGRILKANPARLTGIGYLPKELPRSGNATEDDRYRFRPRTTGDDFSPIQPIQGWIDLLATGVNPTDVELLGVNGGNIAGFEYHLAAMLGAQVGIVDQSGGVADELILRQEELGNQGIQFLPNDRDVLRVFVGGPRHSLLKEKEIDILAERVHRDFEERKRAQASNDRKALARKNRDLHRTYSESNRAQVKDIEVKLRRIDLDIERAKAGTAIKLYRFSPEERKKLARFEHARYVVERLQGGFRVGPRDEKTKRNPTLIAWKGLPPEEKDKDHEAVNCIPEYLKSIGFRIVKKKKTRGEAGNASK